MTDPAKIHIVRSLGRDSDFVTRKYLHDRMTEQQAGFEARYKLQHQIVAVAIERIRNELTPWYVKAYLALRRKAKRVYRRVRRTQSGAVGT